MQISSLALLALPMTAAFAPSNLNKKSSIMSLKASEIYDPMGLYPDDSLERKEGLIKPLETSSTEENLIFDPLSLYEDKSEISSVEMSSSLPFLPRPALLDGSLPGDRGFDPFNFASNADALQTYRKAEIKHARLAMLAAVGWPMSEIFHKSIASTLHLSPLLASQDRAPSILNDGLSHVPFPAFWIATISAAAFLEFQDTAEENRSSKLNPGDFEFDPMNLGGSTEEQEHFMLEGELFNGRLAMLAITGFAVQEFFLGSSVVNQLPFH